MAVIIRAQNISVSSGFKDLPRTAKSLCVKMCRQRTGRGAKSIQKMGINRVNQLNCEMASPSGTADRPNPGTAGNSTELASFVTPSGTRRFARADVGGHGANTLANARECLLEPNPGLC